MFIMETQIKATLRFHLRPVKMAKIITKMAGYDVEKRKHPLLAGVLTFIAYYENQFGYFSDRQESIYLKIQLCHSWTHTQRIPRPTQVTHAQTCSLLIYS